MKASDSVPKATIMVPGEQERELFLAIQPSAKLTTSSYQSRQCVCRIDEE